MDIGSGSDIYQIFPLRKEFYTIDDNFIVINITRFINKSYRWIADPAVLYKFIYNNYKTQTIVFSLIDGESIELSGIRGFILKVKKDFNIPKEKVIVQLYAPIDFPEVTVHIFQNSDFLKSMPYSPISAEIAQLPIDNTRFTKKFLALFGRYTYYRLQTAMHIHSKHLSDSIFRYNDPWQFGANELVLMENLCVDELAWIKNFASSVQDNSIDIFSLGGDWTSSVSDIAKFYTDYFIEITCETDYNNGSFITEKTIRSFLFGKPFVVFGGVGTLEYIRAQGFCTFSPWINESYDNIQNDIDRFNAVMNEVDRLAILSIEQLKVMAREMNEIFVHNRAQLLTTPKNLMMLVKRNLAN
jgi:hypothetical protein